MAEEVRDEKAREKDEDQNEMDWDVTDDEKEMEEEEGEQEDELMKIEKGERNWKDDVEKMNRMLEKEGIEAAVMEIYSPPRVDEVARKYGLKEGYSLDLTTVDPLDGEPWDFCKQEKRDRAERMVSDKKAMLVIGSPMCAAFSQLQTLNVRKMGEDWIENKRREARRHLVLYATIQNTNGAGNVLPA